MLVDWFTFDTYSFCSTSLALPPLKGLIIAAFSFLHFCIARRASFVVEALAQSVKVIVTALLYHRWRNDGYPLELFRTCILVFFAAMIL